MASTMQLEFSQAMSDFKIMFPDMDRDVIEAVLRANQGAVDATIDQLLTMSMDNQNEKLRHEMDSTKSQQRSLIMLNEDEGNMENSRAPAGVSAMSSIATEIQQTFRHSEVTAANGSEDKVDGADIYNGSKNSNASNILGLNASFLKSAQNNTGASPKLQRMTKSASNVQSQLNFGQNTTVGTPSKSRSSRWNPPLVGPLPSGFLRLGAVSNAREIDLPDEQIALMLQNEEFMNQLRWNRDFMMALEKEQCDKSKGEDDADLKERIKNMGKLSRKKFLQMARVFTWQRNKKTNTAKQIDALPLKEEHSDDEDHNQLYQQQQLEGKQQPHVRK